MENVHCQDVSTILNRTPIFDRDKNVWAYELSLHNTALEANTQSEARQVLEDFETQLAPDKKIMLHFNGNEPQVSPESWLLNQRHILSISPQTASQHAHLQTSAREAGALVAMDYDTCAADPADIWQGSDLLKISIKGKSPREVMSIRKQTCKFQGRTIAADIDSWEAYEGTRALGFDYFQGTFFTKPFFSPGEPVSTAAVAKLQILRELNMPECDLTKLSEAIASDVALSYRLLTYINSAAFCIANKIKSIQQAVTLLGLNEIKKWAMVVLMSGMDDSERGGELAYMALQRARFLESMAALDTVRQTAGTMFMLGLFSKLDALLAHPMEQVLGNLPIDEQVKAALCGEDVELRNWLTMLEAVECNDWEKANDILLSHDACLPHAAADYLRSCSWASRQCSLMRQ